MPLTTQAMLADSLGHIVPNQYYDPVQDKFVIGYATIGNLDLAALATGAQVVGTVNSPDQVNNGRGVQVGINITNINGGTYTVTIQGKDVASGTYYTLLASTALAANAFTLLTVYPGVVAAANTAVNAPVPRIWRVSVTVATATVTATVGASNIV